MVCGIVTVYGIAHEIAEAQPFASSNISHPF